MKALTLTQPWATLVAHGYKRIETRSWPTDYRGPLVIHAAKGFPPVAVGLWFEQPFRRTLREIGIRSPGELPCGYVLATAQLVDCRSTTPDLMDGDWTLALSDLEDAFGDFSPGRYGWFLRDVKPMVQPIPARGALGLWDWTPSGVGVSES